MFTAITQIFKPPGINGAAGTPNFLMDIDYMLQTVQYRKITIGGLMDASFQLYNQFENSVNIQAGNIIMHACFGGTLHQAANAGATSVVVDNLSNDNGNGQTFLDIIANDYVLVSNGANTDLMKVSSVTGTGPWTINLASAPGQNTASLLNSYGVGSSICRLLYQGKILQRPRTTNLNGNFQIEANGVFFRYNTVYVNDNIVQQDAGTSMYQLLNTYTSTLPEILINSSNFVQGNGISVSTASKDTPLLNAISDILTQENGQVAGKIWALWVDEVNQVHHKQINTDATAPDFTWDLVNNNAYGDVLGDLEVTDQDITQMVNAAIVQGGTMSDGRPLKIVVIEQDSVGAPLNYGYFEGVYSNNNLTDMTTAANWAAGQLQVTAFPLTTAKLKLVQTSCRLSIEHLLKITGFTDNSTLTFNPVAIQYTLDAKSGIATGEITLAQAKPDVAEIINEIASEKSIRTNPPTTVIKNTYVEYGLDITYSSSSLSVTIALGAIIYNGFEYRFPQTTLNLTANQTTEIGANSSDGAVEQLPNALLNALHHALGIFHVTKGTYGSANTITQVASFAGVPLYAITTNGTGVIGVKDLRVWGGVAPGNIIGVNGATVSVGSVSTTNPVTGSSSTGIDITLTPTYSCPKANIKDFLVIACPHGLATTSSWLYGASYAGWGQGRLDATQIPNSGSACTIHVGGMPTGVAMDLYFFIEGHDGSYIYPSTNPVASATAQTIPTSAMPKMPSGATITVSAVSEALYDGGMHIL